jgi:hypothetical protein
MVLLSEASDTEEMVGTVLSFSVAVLLLWLAAAALLAPS